MSVSPLVAGPAEAATAVTTMMFHVCCLLLLVCLLNIGAVCLDTFRLIGAFAGCVGPCSMFSILRRVFRSITVPAACQIVAKE